MVKASNPDGTVTAPSDAARAGGRGAARRHREAGDRRHGRARLALSSARGTWDGIGNAYAYQWQRDSGAGFVDIAGATGSHLHARRGRRGREGAPARHRDQPGRHARLGQRPDRDGGRRAAGQRRPPRGHRHGAARLHADLDDRHVERRRQRAGLPVAALDRRRDDLDGDQRRDDAHLRAPARRRRLDRADARHRDQPGRDRHADAAPRPGVVAASGPLNTAAPVVSGPAVRARHARARRPAPGPAPATRTPTSGSARPTTSTWTDIRGATLSAYTLGVADETGWVRVIVTGDATPRARTARRATSPGRSRADFPVNLQSPTVSGDDGPRRDADRHPGRVERRGQRLRLPVAARPGLGLREHRRRDGPDLHAHGGRRGRAHPRRGHGDQPGPGRQRGQRGHRTPWPGRRRSTRSTRRSPAPRSGRAR